MSRLGAAVGMLVDAMDGVDGFLGMNVAGAKSAPREEKSPEEKRASKLSHAMSKFMRHTCKKELYGDDGKMKIEDLLEGINPKGKGAVPYTADEVRAIVAAEAGSSKRHGVDATGEFVYCYQGL